MPQHHPAASVSLAVGAVPSFTVNSPPHGLRTALFAGAAVVSGFLIWVKRGHADGVRRRVIRRLDRIAPRTKYHAAKQHKPHIINADCKSRFRYPPIFPHIPKTRSSSQPNFTPTNPPNSTLPPRNTGPVCLCEFAKTPDKPIRVLECRHALCSDCLVAWAVHCTKAHLNPSRFGITRAGRVVSWTPGPKCPLCCSRVNCVPREDLREAVIAAINQRGSALSTIIAYQARSSSASGDFEVEEGDSWRNAASVHTSS